MSTYYVPSNASGTAYIWESAQGERAEVICLLGASTMDTSGGSVRASPLPRWRLPGAYLHGQDKAVAVQGVLPVQQAIQGQCSADVVQGKDAVGIPCKREKHSRGDGGPGREDQGLGC